MVFGGWEGHIHNHALDVRRDGEVPMRSDLDAVRERHISRETREEIWRTKSGDWGWVKAYTQSTRPPADPNQTMMLEPLRPGTSEGGY